MRRIAFLLSAALFLSGCATGSRPALTPEQGAAVLRVTIASGATIALNNNPKLVPAAQAIAAGIGGALSYEHQISSAALAGWVRSVCAAHEIPPSDIPPLIALVQTAHTLFAATYPGVVSTADPRVVLYANAFQAGLDDALAAISR